MSAQTVGWRSTMAAAAAGIALVAVSAGAQVPAAQGGRGGQPAVRGGYTEAATLAVRIMEFRADREAITPGESITLSWVVENPRAAGAAAPVTITPEIGRVAPRTSLQITPKATTTYTLTANGVNGPVTRTVTVTVAGTTAVAASDVVAPLTERPAPRTAEGKPDLTGVYGYGAGGGRGAPPPPAGGIPRTPTLKPGAEQYRVVRGPEDTGLYSSCRPPGVPQTFMVPYYVQLVQSPKYMVIIHEYLSLPRIIVMDAQHPPDPDPFYMGHSVGRWEGDTLVVDSVGFKESEINGYKTTESLRVVERFRRPNLGTLEYEAVIEDPNVFTGPWMLSRNFPLLPEHNRVDEFYCENNRDYRELFGK